MLKKLLLIFATGLLLSTSAFAVPIALDFDKTGLGAFPGDTIYGFHASGTTNHIVHQTLGADNVLNNGDAFYETLTLTLLNGLDSAHNVDPLLQYGSELMTFDASLSGIIANYSNGGTPTVASDPNTVKDDSFVSIFLAGTGSMKDGATTMMTYHLIDSSPAAFTPSVFNNSNVQTNISLAFEVDSINADYFATIGILETAEELVGENFLLAFAQGNVGVDSITGDTAAEPDEILFEIDDNGFDIKFDAVPEPATLLLFGFGLLGLAGFGRKRNS
jgi:hypothetical protein